MLRFSYWVVPVGKVPSTGNALTGSRSPWPAIIGAVTRSTKSGACCRARSGERGDVAARVGHAHLVQRAERAVDRGVVALDDRLPRLP